MRRLGPVAALLLVAAACGGDDAGAPTTPAPAAPTTAVETTVAPTTSVPPSTSPPAATTTAPAESTSTTSPPVEVAWAQLATTEGPSPRSNPVFVIDSESGTAYLHGGRAQGEELDDLWRLDLGDGAWTELAPAGDVPSARFSHTGVWDELRSRLVVFSGQVVGFEFVSDVWAYDPNENRWELLADAGAGPSDRYGSCAGYDAAGDRFLISHGFTDSGRFDDTWSFSLADNAWTDVTPEGDLPVERCLHACSYDHQSGSLVLFGGQTSGAPFLGDTWILRQGAWTEVAEPGPTPRKFPSTVATGQTIVLFGGVGPEGATADVWSMGGEAVWAPLDPQPSPPPRESHGAAFDASTNRMYVFGGKGGEGELADVWVLQLA